ncbi:MAG: M20/M25/M40 family metallo-hydrolase [bacterium]|nr:M20/M25/M40 family metallo-hydrolase [bacterium]
MIPRPLLLLLVVALLTACSAPEAPVDDPVPAPKTTAAPDFAPFAADLADDWGYQTLGDLCTTVGHRLTASPGMARAVAWAESTFLATGFDSTWAEPVTAPRWTRGREWARCTAPVPFDLTISGLGLSDGTGPAGIEADVIVVRDFDELETRADEVPGKIVLYNVEWNGYGGTVHYRRDGASRAAAYGAVATLVRSIAPKSLATPHTGMMKYADDVPRIPACAVTVENARRLQRLSDTGHTPRVHLFMEAENHGDGVCHNVMGEIRGATRPREIILLGGHLDAWDVGDGAHDDGAGCVMAMAAARRLIRDGERPARTVRVVLFTGEELGGYGGRAYLEAHRGELDRYVAAMESDSGCFTPNGFSVRGDSLVVAHVASLAAPLAPLGAANVRPGWAGVDIGPMVEEGIPGIGHRVKGDYFHYHHSPADTFDKVDPELMARNIAALAHLLDALAHEPVPLRDRMADDAVAGSP